MQLEWFPFTTPRPSLASWVRDLGSTPLSATAGDGPVPFVWWWTGRWRGSLLSHARVFWWAWLYRFVSCVCLQLGNDVEVCFWRVCFSGCREDSSHKSFILFFSLYIHDDAWIIKNWTGKKKKKNHIPEVMLRQGTPTHTLPDDDPFTGINGLPKSWLAAMKISRNQPGIGLAF